MARSLSLLDDAAFVAALDESDVPALFKPMPPGEPHWIYNDRPAPQSVERGQTIRVVGFELLMMGLGAAGAALVFQDRLGLLLR